MRHSSSEDAPLSSYSESPYSCIGPRQPTVGRTTPDAATLTSGKAAAPPGTASAKASMSLDAEPPHIFAVSAATHRALISEGKNQAVVISGESGAGKTESARFVLQYLRYVSNATEDLETAVHHRFMPWCARPRVDAHRTLSLPAECLRIACR